MSFDAILARFAAQAPVATVATMVRAAMANILSPRELDALFHDCRERQYQDTLLFSSVVGFSRMGGAGCPRLQSRPAR